MAEMLDGNVITHSHRDPTVKNKNGKKISHGIGRLPSSMEDGS